MQAAYDDPNRDKSDFSTKSNVKLELSLHSMKSEIGFSKVEKAKEQIKKLLLISAIRFL